MSWARNTDGPTRTFLDVHGRQWEVFELVELRRRAERSIVLVFACMEVIRRVREYPPDWHELPAPALQEISEGL